MERFLLSVPLPSLVRFLGILLLIAFIGTYVHFQARNLISGPSIVLTTDPAPLQAERVITLAGEARNIVKLTVNGREIHTDERGTFAEALVLENGYTIVTLSAEDRFGRDTSLTREYVYAGKI